mmetsp:Transcript_38549/g.110247  ORF Transcript_38549/g.110247 Transcript_38549/m.110247 type:complete len:299 (-) Transcript_38549:361-1257(-)
MLIPLLTRLLPIVVAGIFGVLVDVPIPQVAQGVAAAVASSALLERLTRRFFMLCHGGKWARWRLVLIMLYHLHRKGPLVLGDGNFGLFDSRAAFMSEREAPRLWKILSWGLTVDDSGVGDAVRLMDGDTIRPLYKYVYCLPTLLMAPSSLFPDIFEPEDPPTRLCGHVYSTYTAMVVFILFAWLRHGGCMRQDRVTLEYSLSRAAADRLQELLATPRNSKEWAASPGVFDEVWERGERRRRYRLVVVTIGMQDIAAIRLNDHSIGIYTTEASPYRLTRSAVGNVLGELLMKDVFGERT